MNFAIRGWSSLLGNKKHCHCTAFMKAKVFGSTMSKQSKRSKWQAYIDDALMKTGQVTKAAIHGLDGTRWASTTDLQATPEQISKLLASIIGDESSLRRDGIRVGSQNYIFLRSDPGRSIYGRKGADAGICIVKTKKAILIGTYSSGVQPGNCNSVMGKLADYLLQHDL